MIELDKILSLDTLNKIKCSEMSNDGNEKRWILYIHIVPEYISDYDHNKFYVGITGRADENLRWKNGSGYRNQKLFYRAIQKYGWNNMEHIVISRNLKQEDACTLEKIIISELHSDIPIYGYNISSGGTAGGGAPIKLARYNLDGNLIDVFPSVKAAYEHVVGKEYGNACNIGDASLNKDSTSSAYGYLWRRFEEKPLLKIKPYVYPWRVPILQYDLDGNYIREWESIVDAQREIQYGTDICEVCKGELLTAGGYQWKYKTSDIIVENIGSAESKNKKKKHIYVYDLDGNYISDYYGISSAVRSLGINNGNVRSVCIKPSLYKNIVKNCAYGYRWTDEFYDKLPPLQLPQGNRPAVKIDNETKEILDIFASVKEASESVGVSHTSIYACCNGVKTLIKGYSWKFIEDINPNDITNEHIMDLYNKYINHIHKH